MTLSQESCQAIIETGHVELHDFKKSRVQCPSSQHHVFEGDPTKRWLIASGKFLNSGKCFLSCISSEFEMSKAWISMVHHEATQRAAARKKDRTAKKFCESLGSMGQMIWQKPLVGTLRLYNSSTKSHGLTSLTKRLTTRQIQQSSVSTWCRGKTARHAVDKKTRIP